MSHLRSYGSDSAVRRKERFVAIPKSPSRRDPRNSTSAAAIRKAVNKLGPDASTINMSRGYRASAPDLGKLQSLVEPHFDGLSMIEIKKQHRKIQAWVFDLLGEWVQRTKALKVTYDAEHVVIEFKTKDDYGWYVYEFSIYVPPRKRR